METHIIEETRPSIGRANTLYLFTLVLVLLLGSLGQSWSPAWGLIGTELLLILLPTLWWLRQERRSFRHTVRWRWPGWPLMLLALLIGSGVWLVAAWLQAVMVALLGYSPGGGSGLLPTTWGQALVMLIGLSITAPLAEEILFRGYLQPAYERLGGRRAVVIVALLFATYHLTLVGWLPRLPLALALGFVAWRSQSLLPGIALHLSNNLLASLTLAVAGLRPDLLPALPVGTLPTAVFGLVLLLPGLWLFRRQTRAVTQLPVDRVRPSGQRPTPAWRASAPLIAALALFALVAVVEVVDGRFPERLPWTQRVVLAAPSWPATAVWQYEIRNVIDDAVGRLDCRLETTPDAYQLACDEDLQAFDIEHFGRWISGGRQVAWTVRWQPDNLTLLDAVGEADSAGAISGFRLGGAEALVLTSHGDNLPTETLTVPAEGLLRPSLPWQLAALPFATGYSALAMVVEPLAWREATQDSGPLVSPSTVVVTGQESVTVPAGRFTAWRVTVSTLTAWYDTQPPHTLLKFDDGFVTYHLLPAEQ